MATPPDVQIRVREADALEFAADALVLKYAQAPYGADKKAIALTGIAARDLPPPDGFRIVRNPPGLQARALIFLGVVGFREFRYKEVRGFARRALATVAREVPDAREIALTTHGVGFGLDEIESFDSELAGILDAVRAGEVPVALQRVSILEIGRDRARRFADRLDSTLPTQASVPRGASVEEVVDPNAAHRVRTVGFDSAKRQHAWVSMGSFDDSSEDRFLFGVAGPVRESGLLCERIDELRFEGDVLDHVKNRIDTASVVIADLTGASPNVYLEVGFAWGRSVPTVLLCQDVGELRFDVTWQKCLVYQSIKQLHEQLSTELARLLAAGGNTNRASGVMGRVGIEPTRDAI
jgi:hypothetical protein